MTQQLRERNKIFQRNYRQRQSYSLSLLSRKFDLMEQGLESITLTMSDLADRLLRSVNAPVSLEILGLCFQGLNEAIQTAKQLSRIDLNDESMQVSGAEPSNNLQSSVADTGEERPSLATSRQPSNYSEHQRGQIVLSPSPRSLPSIASQPTTYSHLEKTLQSPSSKNFVGVWSLFTSRLASV